MGDLLAKLRFPVLLLLIGALFIATSMLSGLSPAAFNPEPRAQISLPLLVTGVLFVVAGIVVSLAEGDNLPSLSRGRVRRTPTGYTLRLGHVRVNLVFGRLEEAVGPPQAGENQMVVLPTNEFFDDDCSAAANTACGAFVRAKLPNHADQLRKQIEELLATRQVVGQFEKEHGKTEDSYGVGTCLFLKHPSVLPHAILLAAVAMKRAEIGFQSNPAFVYQCVERMVSIATDQRISTIYLPLLGAGKGGLTPSASLMAILLSTSAMQRRLGGFDSAVNVVVFRENARARPIIDRRSAARILRLAEVIHRVH